MDARADGQPIEALLRILAMQVPGSSLGIYFASHGLLHRWVPDAAGDAPDPPSVLAPDLQALLDGQDGARVPARHFGRSDAFAYVQPLPPPGRDALRGGLVLFHPRRRALRAEAVAALRDAAAVLAPLLAAARRLPTRGPAPPDLARVPLRSAILPRLAAQRLIETARARSPDAFALYLIDLDRFHAVNAALGEAAGDAILAVIGARIESCLRDGDRMARLEGDRFLVLAGGAHGAETPGDFATRLLAEARVPLKIAGRSIAVQASIGVVAGLSDSTPTATALMQAQDALRQAKAEGRNRFVLHEPRRDAAALEESRLELDLAEALTRGQLHLVYQAFVDLRDGSTTGVEALMRWRHPARGELPPSLFIPLAETTGLILPMGSWALRTALEAARDWPEDMTIAVNVSALQFHQPGFVADVKAALAASGVAPQRLELEITETVLMRDSSETTAQLDALIGHGVRIALDDFGTGYSALAYLGRLPHHRIKLDRSFIQDLANPATLEMVRAILALAHKTGVGVTAEGVERPDQLQLVRNLGFTHAQGFLTGKPMRTPSPAPDLSLALP